MQLNLLDHTAPLNWGMEFSMEPSISGERQTFPFGLFVSSGQEFPGPGCFVKKRLWSGWRGCPSPPPLVLLSGWQWLQLILVPVPRLCVNNLGGRLQTSSRDTKAESLHHFPLFCFLVLLNSRLNFVHTLTPWCLNQGVRSKDVYVVASKSLGQEMRVVVCLDPPHPLIHHNPDK